MVIIINITILMFKPEILAHLLGQFGIKSNHSRAISIPPPHQSRHILHNLTSLYQRSLDKTLFLMSTEIILSYQTFKFSLGNQPIIQQFLPKASSCFY